MKKLLLILFLLINLVSNGQFYNNYHYKLPYVSNPTVNVVSTTQAIVSFSYSGNGCKVSEVYIEWSDDVVQRSTTQTPINSELVNTSQFIGQMIANSSLCYVFVRVTNCMGYSQSSIIFFSLASQQGAIPTVITNDATYVGTSTANMNGNVTASGDASVSDRGFYYGLTNPPTTKASSHSTGTGTFSVGLGGLQSNMPYFYRAYATNVYGEAFGDIISFTTLPTVTVPIVNTTIVYNVTTESAVLGGNVTDPGGSLVTERGVYFGTSPNPTTGLSSGSGTGYFTIVANNLLPSTTYYYRAYAKNIYGTGYGAEYSFTTLGSGQAPTVTTNSASSITELSATLSGTLVSSGGGTVNTYGINIYESDQTTLIANIPTTAVFSTSYTGLCSNTTYYAEAYAINAYGTGYGSKVEFKTNSISFLYGYNFTYANNISVTDSTSALALIDAIFTNGISATRTVSFNKMTSLYTDGRVYYSNTNCIYPNNNNWTVFYPGTYFATNSKLKPLYIIHWNNLDKTKIFTITSFTY